MLFALGLIAGLGLFFYGFRIYREYRLLADTPEVPIPSIAMGLVEIHGKPQGDQTVTSPVTHTPCFFYKVDIQKFVRDSKGGGSLTHIKTDTNAVKFYLQDETGKVLVDARGAELDLPRTGEVKIQIVPGTHELQEYVMRAMKKPASSPSDVMTRVAFRDELRADRGDIFCLTEYCILPSVPYDVTGTCVENPNPKDEHDRNMIVKGENEPTFLISWKTEKELEGKLRTRAVRCIFGGAALAIVCLAILLGMRR